MIWLLDTNAWSDFIRGRGRVARKLAAIPMVRIVLAAPVLYELRRGQSELVSAARTRAIIDEIAGLYQIIPLDAESAEAAAAIAADLRAKGRHLHHLDTLIAGIAMAAGATLVTRDKAFSGIGRLKVEAW